jgi:hypothetical protein
MPDSRSTDEWIKKFLDDKNKRLNDLRRNLNHLLGPEKGEWRAEVDADELEAAYREDKKTAFPQAKTRIAGGGKWAVVSPEDEIISTWATEEEAWRAARPYWMGLLPSATGPTGGARVKRLLDVRGGGQGSGCQGPNCGRPKVFYHVTGNENVDSILKEGIRPSGERAMNFGQAGVYLTSNRNDTDVGAPPEWGNSVFEVRPPASMKVTKDTSGRNWYVAHGHVKPEHIKLIQKDGKDIKAADIFQDQDHGDRTRARFLKHPKPKVVRDADILRTADRRPSSHGQGSAGTGGTGGPSGGL